jgi:amino acid adenylation domain-containing protein
MDEAKLSDKSILVGFLKSVKEFPENPALCVKSNWLSYKDFDLRARKLATAIEQVRPNRPRIGIFSSRSETGYIGTIAALFLAASFIPLNKNFPAERTSTMIDLAELDAIIVDNESLVACRKALESSKRQITLFLPATAKNQLAPKTFPNGTSYFMEDIDSVEPWAAEKFIHFNEVAYILFTSGSTGTPKGVPVLHSSVQHFISVNQSRYKITPNDRLTQTFDQTFDLSIFDMFMAWSHGACLCVPQALELLSPFKFIREKGVTVWFSVPSVASILIQTQQLKAHTLNSLRLSLFCGEALAEEVAVKWQEAAPHSILENLYGPTELTISCAVYRWQSPFSPTHCTNGIVPIGKIYPGLDYKIVDSEFNEVSQGEAGQLIVAGPQTFPGYLNRPDLTEGAFVQLKNKNGEMQPYYLTGDFVKLSAVAGLTFMGRKDRQIKVQGYRIEVAEVECALRKCEGVTEAAVVGIAEKNSVAKGLRAFISGYKPDAQKIEEALARNLPVYMRPTEILVLNEMPRNVNGKTDYHQLSAMSQQHVGA